jgi:uncharacterized protein GlcG (DUF336 family)
MGSVSLEQAEKLLDAALACATTDGLQPLTIAVLDAGGHLVAFRRQDDSGILRAEIAIGKAYGALGFGFGSRGLSGKNPTFMAAVSVASGGRLVPVPGGVLIKENNRTIGAVGISGDNSDADERTAIAGIEAIGLIADAGA